MIEKIKAVLYKVIGREVGQVFFSERPEFGHYSTNASFSLAKEQKRPPIEVAKNLAEKIKEADKGKLFFKVEAAMPGHVNFWIMPEALQKELASILRHPDVRTKRQKINVEFISANPTGPLTMANGRGGFLGDVLANVFEAVGYKVTREYYINDAGNQIRLLGESVLAALGKMSTKEEHYQGEYIKELAEKLKKKISGHPMSKNYVNMGTSDVQNIEKVGRLAAAELLKQIKKSVKDVGIKFDVWYSEYEELRSSSRTNAEKMRIDAELIKRGSKLDKVLKLLDEGGLVEKKDGALWLKTSDIAGEKDRVLVKSDGQPTYFLADLAYHYDKFIKRKFDKAIDIWGADHHGYVARLKSGVKAIGLDSERLKIIITQMVRLVEIGKEVRMSKRKGEFVTLDELIREVGKDAARFFFLMHAPETHMDFDLALAKEQSQKNPVYYVQYAFVRANSILTKVISNKFSNSKLTNLKTETEINLLNELVKLSYIIRQTAEDYQVSRLARYAMELARAFHNFYEKERVIGAPDQEMRARLALVAASKIIFERLFKVLGIAALEKM